MVAKAKKPPKAKALARPTQILVRRHLEGGPWNGKLDGVIPSGGTMIFRCQGFKGRYNHKGVWEDHV